MRKFLLALSLLVAGPLYGQTDTPACGEDAPCETANGTYHLP